MKMGRWGRGQENRMKLFSGSVSTGLQLSSAFVIYSTGGRTGDGALWRAFFHKQKLTPVRESQIWAGSHCPVSYQIGMELKWNSISHHSLKKKESKKENGSNIETLCPWQINNWWIYGVRKVHQEMPCKASTQWKTNVSHISRCSSFCCQENEDQIAFPLLTE